MTANEREDWFGRQSIRYSAPRTLEAALASCPPGWHPQVREIFRTVEQVGGAVWDAEPKFAQLDVSIEVPEDTSAEARARITALIVEANARCEACGAPGTLRSERHWWRMLCDNCDREVDVHGWADVYQRYRSSGPRP
jgi:Zn finger protein HypA/HybF involved in hydrogenase expression